MRLNQVDRQDFGLRYGVTMLSTLIAAFCLSACGGASQSVSPAAPAPIPTIGGGGTGETPAVIPVDPAGSGPGSGTSMAAEVGTARALNASANLSLDGVLNAPPVAAALASVPEGRFFYLDSRYGDDVNDGRSAYDAKQVLTANKGPWRSLARLMKSGLAAGDTVQLACASVWRESLNLPSNGTAALPITVTAPIGCAAPPTIDGRVALPVSAWRQHRGSIYKASLDAPPLQVFSDGTARSDVFVQAHHPNKGGVAADPASYYLAMAADGNAVAAVNGANIGSTVLNTGVDFSALAADATTPARVRVRINPYVINDLPVSRFEGTQIVLQRATEYQARAGWGFMLTGQLWMLDSPGEWHFDPASRELFAWMPNSLAPTSSVFVSVLDTGVNLQSREHIVVDGLAVRGVGLGVDMRRTVNVQLRNSVVEDTAGVGVDFSASKQALVESNRVSRTTGDAISGWGAASEAITSNWIGDATGSTVRNNLVRDSGVLMDGESVLSLPRRSLAAIFTGTNSVVSGNVIVNAGYIGILANANNTVSENFVYGACSVQDDCGGIYLASNSQVRRNTVVHARGSLPGQPLAQRGTSAEGIYLDDLGTGVTIEDNTVVDCDIGVLLHNAFKNEVRRNRLYANRTAQIWVQEDSTTLNSKGDVSGNVFEENQIAGVSSNSLGMLLTSRYASTEAFGRFSANRYFDRAAPTVVASSNSSVSRRFTLGQWRNSMGVGSASAVDTQATGTSLRGYTNYSVSGGNLVANSALVTNTAGWAAWNQTAPAGQLTREPCPAGSCLRYVAGGSPGVLTSPSFAVQQGRWYRLSVDISSESDNQSVPLVVRAGAPDYASVSDRNLTLTGSRAWSRHSVIFQAKQTLDGSIAGGSRLARVDIDGIEIGKSISLARLEVVAVTPDELAQTSGVFVNAGSTVRSVACPFATSAPALCGKLFNLADDQAITWPFNVPARSAVIAYAQEPGLIDTDGDGIADAQDTCPLSKPGAAVNAAGCEFTPR